MQLLQARADGVDEMRLSHARCAIDEERVEGHLMRVLSYAQSYGARQLVGYALDKVVEGVVSVEVGVELLQWLWSGVSRLRRHRLAHGGGAVCAALVDGEPVFRIHLYLIYKFYAPAVDAQEHLTQQRQEVRLDMLAEIGARHTQSELVAFDIKAVERHGRKPDVILLLADVVAYDLQTRRPALALCVVSGHILFGSVVSCAYPGAVA